MPKTITEQQAARGLDKLCWDCLANTQNATINTPRPSIYTDSKGIMHSVSHDDSHKTVCGKEIKPKEKYMALLLIKQGSVPAFYSCKKCTWLGPQLAFEDGRGVCPNCGSRSLGVHFGEHDILSEDKPMPKVKFQTKKSCKNLSESKAYCKIGGMSKGYGWSGCPDNCQFYEKEER